MSHQKPSISRRRFLRLGITGSVGALLASLFVKPTAEIWHRIFDYLDRQPYLRPVPPAPDLPGQSTIFHVSDFPKPTWTTPYHEGLEALLNLMADNGLPLYQTGHYATLASPDGLISADDVILLKVNSQWAERGMTNTDVLRGLIQRLIEHPDGFQGEIVVVENGQEHDYLDSHNQNNDDLADHSQSAKKVVAMFATDRVSLYPWVTIGRTAVAEFDAGDEQDGYVLAGDYPFNYPKFTTARGTCVSLRKGIWNGSSYDHSRLKLINLPVLKAHVFMGTTAAVKNYAGVMSRFVGDYDPGDDWDYHANFYQPWKGNPPGLLGRLMALRFPVLNILDASYVNPATNWAARFSDTPRVGALLASTDPVALDYYASKEILLPMKQQRYLSKADWSNPDVASVFRRYLLASQARLLEAGYTVRLGPEAIRVIHHLFA